MFYARRSWSVVVVAVLVAGSGVAGAGDPDQGAGSIRVLARFDAEVPRALETVPGVRVLHRFASVPAIAAEATPAAVRALGRLPGLANLEAEAPLAFDLDTATVASRARDVTDAAFEPGTPPVLDADGAPVDGRGVGIAIVDTGLDGLHPDFAEPGKVGGNYQVTPAGVVAAPWTSTTDGHGTHVAGIAAGTGALAAQQGLGDLRGVAPGATLYAFNMFFGTQILAAIAFDWIAANGASQEPPIRVVNNSWHCAPSACGHPLNDGGDGVPLHIVLASEMVAAGITVTWAAGNVRGRGEVSTVSVEANNPTPGIVGVANYKDDDSAYEPEQKGRRDGCLSGSSAWGASADPTTWPDVAAPGRSITSTWALAAERDGVAPNARNPLDGSRSYATLTGTSMAAPHVAGIVALLLQVRPSLLPAQVEYLLKQTATPLVGEPGPGNDGCGIAYPKADPAHPWTGSNYAAGHGLVHAYDAALLARDFTGIPSPAPDPEPLPPGFVISTPGIRVDRTLYLADDGALVAGYPDADAPTARAMEPNRTLSHSATLSDPVTFDALTVDAYIGSSGEYADMGYLGTFQVRARLYRTPAGGVEEPLAEIAISRIAAYPGMPVHRDLALRLVEPVTLNAGDQIRVAIGTVASPYYTTDPPINAYWVLYTEAWTPTRIGFGTQVQAPAPDTRPGCERYTSCAEVDATHPYEGMVCGTAPVRLRWAGPPGSTLVFVCDGVVTLCPASDVGICETEVEPPPAGDARATIHPDGTAARAGVCTYRLEDGARGGWGRCEVVQT